MDGRHVISMNDRFHPVHVQCGEGFLQERADHRAADPLVPVVLFANDNPNFTCVVIVVNVFDGAVANELGIDQNTNCRATDTSNRVPAERIGTILILRLKCIRSMPKTLLHVPIIGSHQRSPPSS